MDAASVRSAEILTAPAEGIIVQDENGHIQECNPRAQQILGLTADRLVGLKWTDLSWRPVRQDGTSFPAESHPVELTLRTGLPQSGVIMGIHKPGGSLTWISMSTLAVTRNGRSKFIVVTFSELAAQGLSSVPGGNNPAGPLTVENEDRYRALFANNMDAVFFTRSDGAIEAANPVACELFGMTEQELCALGRGGLTDASEPKLAAALETRQMKGWVRTEFTFVRKNGSRFEGEVHSVILNSQGRGFVIVRDITERKRADRALGEAIDFNRQIMDSAREGIVVYDRELRYRVWNRFMETMTGLPAEDVLGRHAVEVFPFLVELGFIQRLQRVLAGETPEGVEFPYDIAGGRSGWVSDVFAPLRNDAGEIIGVIATVRDISEQKTAEKARQAAEEEYREVFAHAPEGIYRTTREGKLLAANPALATMLGFDSPEEMIASTHTMGTLHWVEPAERERFVSLLETNPTVRDYQAQQRRRDGVVLWCSLDGRKVSGPDGDTYYEGFIRDITESKRMLDALRESEARYRTVVASATDGIVLFDRQGRILTWNGGAERILGVPAERAIGHTWKSGDLGILHEDGSDWLGEDHPVVFTSLSGRVCQDAVVGMHRASGDVVWINVNSAPVYSDSSTEHSAVVVTFTDITARKRMEDALREREYWLRESQRVSRIGSYVLDVTTDTWASSATLDEIFGIGSGYPHTTEGWMDLVHPEDRDSMQVYLRDDVIGRRRPFDREYRIVRCNDGEVRWVHGRGLVLPATTGIGLIMTGTVQDVTDRKCAQDEKAKLEMQLMQAQKMESIGRLAGGVAHDFNNLLTVINGYGKMALRDTRSGDPLRARLEEICKAGERAAGLTSQLLAFSRKQVMQPRVLQLNGVVEGMQSMLQRLVGEDVDVHISLSAEEPTVEADPHQLEQVILNLAVNARDAMPMGGRMLIETAVLELDQPDPALHPDALPGRYVVLSVSDTGVGMDEATRQRIFEPFFTTKRVGEGTGLGLSMVQGIVAQSGGFISVSSQPGLGAAFHIYLRALPGFTSDAEEFVSASALHGSETILVVEDQADVRGFAVAVLQSYGYRVLEAGSAGEALAICEREGHRIQMVLTDVVMPQISGRELVDRLLVLRPAIKFLFMSGHTDSVIAQHGILEEGRHFIQKPFSPEDLAVRVRSVLGPAARVYRILVVDDEDGVRLFLRTALEQAGYEVVEAANGRQALQRVGAENVDLMITDLVMPEQEGIETIRQLRTQMPSLGIIAISGAFGGQFLRTAEMLGADAVLDKPVSPDLLYSKVAEVISRRRAANRQ